MLDGVEDELADELDEEHADVAGGDAARGLDGELDAEPVEPAHVLGEPAERLVDLLGLEGRGREVDGEFARGLERLLEDPAHLVDEPRPLGRLGGLEHLDVEPRPENELLDVVVEELGDAAALGLLGEGERAREGADVPVAGLEGGGLLGEGLLLRHEGPPQCRLLDRVADGAAEALGRERPLHEVVLRAALHRLHDDLRRLDLRQHDDREVALGEEREEVEAVDVG